MGTGAGLNRALGSNGSGALLTVQALDRPRKLVDEVVHSRTPLGGRGRHFYLRGGARAARSGHLLRAGGAEDLEHSHPVVVRRRSFKKGLKRAGGRKDRGFMSPKKSLSLNLKLGRGHVPIRGFTRRSARGVGRYGPLFRAVARARRAETRASILFNSLDVDR